MKIQLDSFLKAEDLVGKTIDKPQIATIKNVSFVEASDLGFKSEEGRFQLIVEFNDDTFEWLANKTSLKAIKSVYGSESNDWIGKKIGLYALDQNVSGELKKVVYAKVIAK